MSHVHMRMTIALVLWLPIVSYDVRYCLFLIINHDPITRFYSITLITLCIIYTLVNVVSFSKSISVDVGRHIHRAGVIICLLKWFTPIARLIILLLIFDICYRVCWPNKIWVCVCELMSEPFACLLRKLDLKICISKTLRPNEIILT